MNCKRLTIMICLAFIWCGGLAQNLYFQSYTSGQGLSQNSVYSIAQTKEGFMWFGTQDGLNRFDGKNFTSFVPLFANGTLKKDGFRMASKAITALCADSDDRLWVGTTQEVILYNRYTDKFIFPEEVYNGFTMTRGHWIKNIVEDKYSNIWILTQNDGLFCYNKRLQKMTLLTWAKKDPGKIIAFACNNGGDIWAASENEIYKLDGKVFSPVGLQKIFPGRILISDISVVNDQLWFINASETLLLQPATAGSYKVTYFSKEFKGQKILSDSRVIHQSDSNTAWVGSRSEGLIRINLVSKTFENAGALETTNSLKRQFILSFFTNRQKITWVGLSGGGIAKYDHQKMQFGLWRNEPLPNERVPDNMLLSVFSDNDEDFYNGTLTRGLLHTNIKTGKFEYFQPGINRKKESNNIYAVIAGEKNLLWMATWGGLCSFDKITKKIITYTDAGDAQTKQLCSLIKIKGENKLLTGGYKGGLRLFDIEKKRWENCKDEKNILANPNLRVRYMKEMDSGNIFMSTEARNLVRYNFHTGEFTFFPQLESISGTSRYFYFDNLFLWVATDDGLIQVEAASMQIVKVWSTDNGLPNNYIYSVMPDNYGHIWLSCNAGLALLDYRAGICKKFTEDDGLQSMEFNTASCYKDKEGKLWFGGINGLNMVDPQLTAINNYSPTPVITNINVMNVPYQSDTAIPYIHSISLPYSKNFISFEFQSPNFSQSENIIYEYMLKGVDTGWVKNGTRSYVSYTQLKPGNYSFLVKSANANYVWSNGFTSVDITIIPPWYKAWWFYLVFVLFGTALFSFFMNQRIKTISFRAATKQKIAETEMASLKAQMNPHFMFNCINSIDAFIQTNDKYNATLYLNKFAKLIRNVLDSSKENLVTFSKDIDTLKLYIELEELRSDNKFITTLHIDEELMSSDYKVPPLIVQPFVENAIIHGLRNKDTNDGMLSVTITKTDMHIIYSITDNGIGRTAAQHLNTGKQKSYGIQMSYDRIRLFNKEATAAVLITDLYENEKPSGTNVQVHLNIV